MGTIMIRCPNTGRAISTSKVVASAVAFRSMAVFFGRTYCPHCRVKHEWFAKDGWVCEPDVAVLDLQHNGGVMDRTISRLNIEHYRRKLATEQDETTRQTLMRLLAEEQAKLAAIDNSLEGKRPSG